MQIKVLSEVVSDVGEGPLYNASENSVTWVDITGKKWHKCNFDSGKTISHDVPKMIGAIVERKNGGYFGAVEEGFAEIDTTNGYEVVIDFLPAEERMNDAKADGLGRWWAGSNAIDFTAGKGQLHKLNPDKSYETVLTGLTLPNGLGWSPDNTKFYLVDTFASSLWIFDFDYSSGKLSNQKLMHKFDDSKGYPDGMCVTNDGTLLIAMWDGSRIEVISSSGEVQEPIHLPVQRPTSCTFGGLLGDELIVTTAARELDLNAQPLSGKLLSLVGTGFSASESNKYHG
jgi:sugar lactone lactonase YvrE